MSQEDFMEAQRQHEDIKIGLREILDLGLGLPNIDMTKVYSKIRARFPDKDAFWILTETYLCMGKE